jgi:hypothetical protein
MEPHRAVFVKISILWFENFFLFRVMAPKRSSQPEPVAKKVHLSLRCLHLSHLNLDNFAIYRQNWFILPIFDICEKDEYDHVKKINHAYGSAAQPDDPVGMQFPGQRC